MTDGEQLPDARPTWAACTDAWDQAQKQARLSAMATLDGDSARALMAAKEWSRLQAYSDELHTLFLDG